MSHFHERKEKNCLNCGTTVVGRYCHACGQENIEPRESIWHLVIHYFNDITHFDGKFFSTTRELLFRPGHLPKEYMLGRRVSYLNPIRMYVFTSAVFFLLFFAYFFKLDQQKINGKTDDTIELLDRIGKKTSVMFQPDGDVIIFNQKVGNVNHPNEEMHRILDSLDKALPGKTGVRPDSLNNASVSENVVRYKSRAAYDSVQELLPPGKRDGWYQRNMEYQRIRIRQDYGGNFILYMMNLVNKFLHLLPTIMFVSLPLFAFILNLLYWRKKQFYYVNHVIFTIHLYIFNFMMALIILVLGRIEDYHPSGFWDILQLLIWLLAMFYLYKAMRYFYGESTGMTILKFLLINLLSGIGLIILFAIFATYTLANS